MTALFVARNGKAFLSELMMRETRNFQFDFLHPQHTLFPTFTRLVEQYTKVLYPADELVEKAGKDAASLKHAIERVKRRAAWVRYETLEKKKREEQAAAEKCMLSFLCFAFTKGCSL